MTPSLKPPRAKYRRPSPAHARRQCKRKQRYSMEEAAQIAGLGIWAGMEPFICSACGFVHFGHKTPLLRQQYAVDAEHIIPLRQVVAVLRWNSPRLEAGA